MTELVMTEHGGPVEDVQRTVRERLLASGSSFMKKLSTDQHEHRIEGVLWKPLAALVGCDEIHGHDREGWVVVLQALRSEGWIETFEGPRRLCSECQVYGCRRWVRITMAGYQAVLDMRLGARA